MILREVSDSIILTLWSPFKFPRFLKRVRNEGAEAEVVVRLTTFDEINVRILSEYVMADGKD